MEVGHFPHTITAARCAKWPDYKPDVLIHADRSTRKEYNSLADLRGSMDQRESNFWKGVGLESN
jgi:hypothetical protein